MSLTPPITIKFDSIGLGTDDDYVLDELGVGHFQQVKAGSTWQFDLKFTGVDASALTWSMDVRRTIADATTLLSTSDGTITQLANPTTADPERIRFTVTATNTLAALQANGQGVAFVYDILVADGADADLWVTGSGTVRPIVTR
tara:strand:+ start:310 stop:741 length:432 start_codon:yes stop_codon:yes gene_type:complete